MWKTASFVAALAIYVFYCAAAVFSVAEIQKMMEESLYLDTSDGTLYVPLVVCESENATSSSSFFDTVIGGTSDECHSLKFLIYACSMSLVFSIAATAIYSILSVFVVCKRGGPFNRSSSLGMALFLCFILLQSAVCLWALGSECNFWTDYFTRLYVINNDNITAATPDVVKSVSVPDINIVGGNFTNTTGTINESIAEAVATISETSKTQEAPSENNIDMSQVERVTTYGNPMYLWITAGLAVCCAVLLLLSALIQICCAAKDDSVSDAADPSISKMDLDLKEESFTDESTERFSPQSAADTLPDVCLSASGGGSNSDAIMAASQVGSRPSWTSIP